MSWELISILRIHLGASLEHPLVHLPVLAHACIELKGGHTSFLEDVLSHALLRINIHWRLRGSFLHFFFLFSIFWRLINFNCSEFLILVFRNFLSFHCPLIFNYWFWTISWRILTGWYVLWQFIRGVLAVVLNDYLTTTRGSSWELDGYLLGRLVDFDFRVNITVGVFWWIILRCVWSVIIALIWIRLGAWAGWSPNYLVIHWFKYGRSTIFDARVQIFIVAVSLQIWIIIVTALFISTFSFVTLIFLIVKSSEIEHYFGRLPYLFHLNRLLCYLCLTFLRLWKYLRMASIHFFSERLRVGTLGSTCANVSTDRIAGDFSDIVNDYCWAWRLLINVNSLAIAILHLNDLWLRCLIRCDV